MHAICLGHPILDFITLIIFGEDYSGFRPVLHVATEVTGQHVHSLTHFLPLLKFNCAAAIYCVCDELLYSSGGQGRFCYG
jgi:hypothetical protein